MRVLHQLRLREAALHESGRVCVDWQSWAGSLRSQGHVRGVSSCWLLIPCWLQSRACQCSVPLASSSLLVL